MERQSTGGGLETQGALRRFLKGLRALVRVKEDPNDTEQVLAAALLFNAGTLPRLLACFESDSEGRELLAQRPALDAEHVDLDRLGALPEGSLGRAYSAFLRARDLSPGVFIAPREIHDERMRYVSQRLRQTHDIWHVVTGYDTDLVGEIELQAFTYAQLRGPFGLIVGTLGLLRVGDQLFVAARRAWAAYRLGRRAEPLGTRIWERDFAKPLAEVRRRLGLTA